MLCTENLKRRSFKFSFLHSKEDLKVFYLIKDIRRTMFTFRQKGRETKGNRGCGKVRLQM